MSSLNLLVVDDDTLVLQAVQMALPDQWRMNGVDNPDDVPLNKKFHAALVDMHLTGNTDYAEGVDLIKSLRDNNPHLEIIAMSGNLDRDLMERCLKAGASRFLAKPLSVQEIELTLDKIEALYLMQSATSRGSKGRSYQWVGSSKSSEAAKRNIAQLRGEPGPFLLEGESGTGKEVAAQLIHSQNPGAPFMAVNIAAIPDNLFESELFGHVKGAFTGADQNKMGLAEAANGGDLFLDEIEALSLPLQVKLLRFLETGEVRRVGSQEPVHINCRVIVATNQNLDKMVAASEFREDLLWRLNGNKIVLPPLRERMEDVEALTRFFLERDKVRKKELSDDALEALGDYHWPGNVRELKRMCEQLLTLSPLPLIRREDVLRLLKPSAASTSGTTSHIDFSEGLATLLDNYEASLIKMSLEKVQDIDDVAKMLKISRSSLYKKIKDHGIEWRNG